MWAQRSGHPVPSLLQGMWEAELEREKEERPGWVGAQVYKLVARLLHEALLPPALPPCPRLGDSVTQQGSALHAACAGKRLPKVQRSQAQNADETRSPLRPSLHLQPCLGQNTAQQQDS